MREIENDTASDPTSSSGNGPKQGSRLLRYLKRLDLSRLILLSMALGILTGLMFGEYCDNLTFIGKAFIRLMQMTVLPYVMISLIKGIGKLNARNAKRLAIYGGLLIVLVWIVSLTVVMAMGLGFPRIASASFFSTTQVTEVETIDPLRIFIPSNPFESMAENTIPAVVLFTILIGVALIGVKTKDVLLENLAVLDAAIGRLTGFVLKLAPIGIFSLTAAAAGSIRLQQLAKLQVYFVAILVGAVLVSFFVLPYIVTRFAGLRYRRVLVSLRSALILAFSSGSSFITLPLIEEAVKELMTEAYPKTKDNLGETEVMIPIAYNFPAAGKLLLLIFVLFTAWFYNKPLSLVQQLGLCFSGVFSFFAEGSVAVPFLLDQMQLPADAFYLYLISIVFSNRMEVLANVMSVFAVTILYIGIVNQVVRITARKVLMTIGVVLVSVLVVALGVRSYLTMTVRQSTQAQEQLMAMTVEDKVPATVHTEIPKPAPPLSTSDSPVGEDTAVAAEQLVAPQSEPELLDRVSERGVLRVGYNPSALPFAYFNGENDLVGYDISFAHHLAKSLSVGLEFIPFEYADLCENLDSGVFDIAMSAVSITYERLRSVDFTDPYMEVTLALVVQDHRRDEFGDGMQDLITGQIKVAAVRGSAYIEPFLAYMPGVEIVEISTRDEFFDEGVADAMLASAEQGSAWTLLHPSYTVVILGEDVFRDFIAFAIAKHNANSLIFLNQWLNIAKRGGFAEREYDYWILGKDKKAIKPRWSVIRDVLHLLP